jgi:aspartate/tyrosine/aromatic aminotransferase
LIVFLGIGVILFFALVSYLISALFAVTTGQTQDAKNQIIQAKTLVEASMKLTSNTAAFDATIKDVEVILTDLESKQLYIKDIQEIRGKIEAMKKEIYDIQVIDLTSKTSIIPFDSEKFSPIGVFENDKKLYIVGEEDMIWDFALGETTLKMKEYHS